MLFFFFNDPATTEIYTLSLHDALPISLTGFVLWAGKRLRLSLIARTAVTLIALAAYVAVVEDRPPILRAALMATTLLCGRSEEHTSELQSRLHLVCRLLLEKKKERTRA